MQVRSPSRSRFAQLRVLAPVLAAALCYSAAASALGLGELTLRSSLNQPFRADIALLDTAGLEESDVSASLGTAEEFSRAGVERSFFLNDLKFSADFSGARKVIHVSSSKAVTEPYMSFVVQVGRPNGQLLRTFTVLLDPPGMGPGLAERTPQRVQASAATATSQAAAAAVDGAPTGAPSRVALPPATEGKRYEVAKGDNLWSIGKRLEQAGTTTPVNELVRSIRALNPQSGPLKAGQSLLLPDGAVLPGDSKASAQAGMDAAAGGAKTAEALPQDAAQLTAAALENQQLQKRFEEVQAHLQSLEAQVAEKDQQVAQLQARLAEAPLPEAPLGQAPLGQAPLAKAPLTEASPADAPSPVVTSATQVPDPVPDAATSPALAADTGSWLNILALVAALLLVTALLLLVRRQRQRKSASLHEAFEPVAVRPVQATATAPVSTDMAVEQPAPKRAEPAAAPRREAPTATDALDGASIYIAYGRFNEALGILRDGLAKQPERTDLRVRMLEVLGQQGNAKGFAEQEALLLAGGFSAVTLAAIRGRYPTLEPAPVAPVHDLPLASAVPTSTMPLQPAVEPVPVPELPDVVSSPAPVQPPAKHEQQEVDEFQLNLDDLSMDADWALVSPFDDAPAPKGKPTVPPSVSTDTVDPAFTSNLKELPEVFEMPEEQFLSDFADVEDEPFLQQDDTPVGKTQDDIDNDFLDSFIADSDLPELDALTVDFDDLEHQHASAQKLEQAQQYLDEGDTSGASLLLHELLREGDDSCKQAARHLLARMDEA